MFCFNTRQTSEQNQFDFNCMKVGWGEWKCLADWQRSSQTRTHTHMLTVPVQAIIARFFFFWKRGKK